MVIPFRYVMEAAREEVKVWEETHGTPRAVYAKQLASYTLRHYTSATLEQVASVVGYSGYRSVIKAVASVAEAIADGDKGIGLGGEWFAGSLQEAAARVWAKAQIRAATERTVAA